MLSVHLIRLYNLLQLNTLIPDTCRDNICSNVLCNWTNINPSNIGDTRENPYRSVGRGIRTPVINWPSACSSRAASACSAFALKIINMKVKLSSNGSPFLYTGVISEYFKLFGNYNLLIALLTIFNKFLQISCRYHIDFCTSLSLHFLTVPS